MSSPGTRPIWKGAIRFGLVNIPVALLTAESRDEIDLDMLDKRDLSPIGYATVSKRTGRKVERDNIVKGYKIAPDQYVTVTEDDFRRVRAEASQTIELVDFVEHEAIDPRYFDRPYYLSPLAKAERPYTLLRAALDATGRVGIGRVVLHTREHLAAVYPLESVLVCNLLRFAHDLRKLPTIAPAGRVPARELALAKSLVESQRGVWRPQELVDTYHRDLVRLLEKKGAAGGELPPLPRPAAPKSNVVDLVDLLRRSVEEGANARFRRRTTAPSRGTRGRTASATRRSPGGKRG